jgi:hypothetical protein
MRGIKHKKACGCVDCIRSFKKELIGTTDSTTIKIIINKYKKLIIKNLKFKPTNRGRFKNRLILSKEYRGDEWIILNEYQYHLIKCWECRQIAKAPRHSRRNCCECLNRKHSNEPVLCTDWSSWSRSA